MKEQNEKLILQEVKHSADLKLAQENNLNADKFIEDLKNDLTTSRNKIDELNKSIGRYESREESSEKNTSDKDKEIFSYQSQIKDLLNTVQIIKDQIKKESEERILDLESQLKEYREKVSVLKEEQMKEIDLLENKHREEIILFKEKLNSSTTVDTIQIENMTKLLKEKDSLLESTQKSYQALLQAKTEGIETLNEELGKMKESIEETRQKLAMAEEENRLLVDRCKEEVQSVLSLKSANTSEDKLASKEELNENMKILSEFFDDPYTKTLKKIFKLKRLRKEDSSVDSITLMPQNHHNEVREYEEVQNEENIEKVKEKDVNEGRVEDLAKPGQRPQPLRGNRGRGGPTVRRRGGPINRGRGGAMMPPRHNVPNKSSKNKPSKGSQQNINILDPSSKSSYPILF